MLVQQLPKSLHAANYPAVPLKLDIMRAFNTVSWLFLIELLRHFRFGRSRTNLVCLLLSTSSTWSPDLQYAEMKFFTITVSAKEMRYRVIRAIRSISSAHTMSWFPNPA
jgi:hypothetical protein